VTGEQMQELLQDPTVLKYAYTWDAEMGIDYLIDNLIARAKEYGLDDVVDELRTAMDKVREASETIFYFEGKEDKEITYGK
jgi:hypothetical protein